jgi:hypothetical protein
MELDEPDSIGTYVEPLQKTATLPMTGWLSTEHFDDQVRP